MPDTIDRLVRIRAEQHGDKPMVIDTESRISYAELDETTRAMAAAFIEAGVGKGTRVGLIMPNRVQWVQIAVALTRIGAVLVPLSTLLQPPELVAQLRVASVQVLIAVEEFRGHRYLDDLADVVNTPELPALRKVWTPEQLAKAGGDQMVDAMAAAVTPSDTLVIMFTSGSSGPPKGVIHSHGNALAAVRSGLAARCIDADTRLYLPMPFFWVGGFGSGVLSALLAGATLVTEEIPRPETTLRLLERERVTLFRGWPDQAEALARQSASVGADLSALRPGSLEALLPPEQRAEPGARAKLFGMTESFGPYCGYPADTDMPRSAWGSCGKPFDGMEVRIVDPDTGQPVPAGTIGMIQIRGPHTLRGICRRSREELFTPTATTPPATSGTSTTTASCSTTADPTTCSRSAAPPSTPVKSSRRCGPSTASRTRSSPMSPALVGGAVVICDTTVEQPACTSRAKATELLQDSDGVAAGRLRRRHSARHRPTRSTSLG